jgi:hypothetical protein
MGKAFFCFDERDFYSGLGRLKFGGIFFGLEATPSTLWLKISSIFLRS